MLHQVAPEVWEQRGSCRFKGFRLARRMTVIRLADGLWLHSPNAPEPALRAAVDALGEVRYLVAPNLYHHAHLDGWKAAYPEARLVVPPGFAAKRPDVPFDGSLDGALPWGEAIEALPIDGIPELNEVALFHRPSATLLVADLLFRFGPDDPWATRMLGRVDGTYGRPGLSRHARWTLVQDKAAFARSTAALCDWPVERLLAVHARGAIAIDPAELRTATGRPGRPGKARRVT